MKTNDEVIFENRGKIIVQAYRDILTPDKLTLVFDDGDGMTIEDIRQYGNEIRSMTCDVNLQDYWGSRLIDVNERDECVFEDISECECHQMTNVEIITSKGSFEIVFHNLNDGSNNGFVILIDPVSKEWFDGR